jgi:hypothetical protein
MKKLGLYLLLSAMVPLALAADPSKKLRDALVFYSSFDHGLNAERGGGDEKLYWAPKIAFPPDARPGLPPSGVVALEKSGGVHGGCLRFTRKAGEMVFFHAPGNMPYAKNDWHGTVSFWLSLTPDEDLEPGFTDPIQLTSKGWDNAAFFVEFSKDEKPRELRLGVYADKHIWNPLDRDWNSIPFAEKPLLLVIKPPFSRDAWTHIAFTFENFNTGRTNGVATLHLNGVDRGTISPREQTFTWDIDKALIMLGLSYVGRLDELAIFNRALTQPEIETVFHAKSLLSAP